jgi:hypothetical protein
MTKVKVERRTRGLQRFSVKVASRVWLAEKGVTGDLAFRSSKHHTMAKKFAKDLGISTLVRPYGWEGFGNWPNVQKMLTKRAWSANLARAYAREEAAVDAASRVWLSEKGVAGDLAFRSKAHYALAKQFAEDLGIALLLPFGWEGFGKWSSVQKMLTKSARESSVRLAAVKAAEDEEKEYFLDAHASVLEFEGTKANPITF